MSASVSSRRVLPLSALLLSAACDPLSCQGRVTDGIQAVAVDDIANNAPRCVDGKFEGDADVTDQAELDTLLDCNTVKGSIIIHDSVDIVDLTALATLERIESGYLLLLDNEALTNVDLPSLTLLDNGFTAIGNPELTRVNLPELPAMKGDLALRANPKLSQVTFPKVEQVQNSVVTIAGVQIVIGTGNVLLAELPELRSLANSFPLLERIEGSLEVYATGLTDFEGLNTLREILNTGGAAQQRTKNRVDKLNPGLAVGIDFDDQFNIVAAGNPALKNFAGLEALDTIQGDIVVGFNPELVDFTGLDDIKTIANGGAAASLYVFENDKLTSFLGLEGDGDNDPNAQGFGDNDGLDTITGSLFIGLYFDRFGQPIAGGNDSLVNLSGLDNLLAINGAAPGAGLVKGLVLGFNAELENLEGLTLLSTLNGDLTILGSQQLQDLKGAPLLETINGSLNFGHLLRRDGQPFNPNELVVENQLRDGSGAAVNPGVKFDPDGGQNGFDALTQVNKDLVVAFSDLNDLRLSDPGENAALENVGGRVILYGNAAPDSLEGLETVTTLGGLVVNFAVDAFNQLQPFPNNGFSDFTGLAATSLGTGGLHLGFDGSLDDAAFATLPALTQVAGSVTLARAVNQDNLGPTDLASLSIGNVGGDLIVCAVRNGDSSPQNADLGNLEALNLNNVDSVGGDLIISFCSNLETSTLGVSSVGGVFEMTDLPQLGAVNGMNGLLDVGALFLHDLADVADITMPGLSNVAGNVEVVDNPSLETTDFGLQVVGGTLRFVNLAQLTNLDGLSNLRSVGGDLDLIDDGQVANTNGLDQLVTVGGDLRLRRLPVVNSAEGNIQQGLSFASLTTVGGLEITQMENLADLAGFETLSIVGVVDADNQITGSGALIIDGNPQLETLFGLQGITQIARKLAILNNPELDRFAFDDDAPADRVLDLDDANQGGIEDDTNEAGLLANNIEFIGVPLDDAGVPIGGQTGVIEVRNNPKLRERDGDDPLRNNRTDPGVIDSLVNQLQTNFEGLLLFCGNEDSADVDGGDPRQVFTAACPEAQDGVIVVADGSGEGEGEGE